MRKYETHPTFIVTLGKAPFFSPNVNRSHVLHWCTSMWFEDVNTFIWKSIWIYLGGWIIGFKYLWLHLFNGKFNILCWRICFWMVFNLNFFVKNLKMRGLNLEANIMDIHEPTILFLLMHDSCVGQPWAYANC